MSKKLTPWFDHKTKPARKGVYEVKFDLWGKRDGWGFSYWNGRRWTNALDTIKRAYERSDWVEGAIQEKKWRGLTKEAA